jgi:hypothetical protein
MPTAASEGHESKASSKDSGDPPSPQGITMEFLAQRMEALFEQQTLLLRMVNRNSDHVLKLHQTIDPLTWKKRAAILFSGAFTGGGTAALLAHFLLHFVYATPPPQPLPAPPPHVELAPR